MTDLDSAGTNASKLIEALDATGLFKGVGYHEVISACGYIAARALHRQKGIPSERALTAIASVYAMMAQEELRSGSLARSWQLEPST